MHVLASRKAKIEGDPQLAAPEFRIEAPGTDGEGPDWDLVERRADVIVLEEVKRGSLGAEDRRILWRRARETVSASGIEVGSVRRSPRRREVRRVGSAWPVRVSRTAGEST